MSENSYPECRDCGKGVCYPCRILEAKGPLSITRLGFAVILIADSISRSVMETFI